MAKLSSAVKETEPRVSADDARKTLGELIDRATDGECIVITRHDRDRVVIISMRDYERLRALDTAAA